RRRAPSGLPRRVATSSSWLGRIALQRLPRLQDGCFVPSMWSFVQRRTQAPRVLLTLFAAPLRVDDRPAPSRCSDARSPSSGIGASTPRSFAEPSPPFAALLVFAAFFFVVFFFAAFFFLVFFFAAAEAAPAAAPVPARCADAPVRLA